MLLMSALQTGLIGLIDVLKNKNNIFSSPDEAVLTLLVLTFMWFTMFVAWTLFYGFIHARRRTVQLEFDHLAAELRVLQAQVNPHFFFNSLNSIRSLVYDDADAAAQAINRLAAMMRHNLESGQHERVRLADEWAAVQAYLDMERLRFEERLQVSLDLPAALERAMVPGMILQTLVENAVKHGVEPRAAPCALCITARTDGPMLEVCVANQGQLAGDSGSTRIGLANAHRRLVLMYGSQARCDLEAKQGWVMARMVLPLELA